MLFEPALLTGNKKKKKKQTNKSNDRYDVELELEGDATKRAKTEENEESGDGGNDGEEPAVWLFNCICGQRVHSSAPIDKHPQGIFIFIFHLFFPLIFFFFLFSGDMFACEECNEWSHLNCYVEFKDFSNEQLDVAKIFCRKCKPENSNFFQISTATISKILNFCDFDSKKKCALVCKSINSLARESEKKIRIRHSSPDVVMHLISQMPNVTELTLYCWHAKLAKKISNSLKSLTLISCQPHINLGGIPRNLELFQIHDSAVTDSALMAALGRAGRNLNFLNFLNLAGTSVTGQISANLIPAQISTLILTCTPVNDLGLMVNICRPEEKGNQFENLKFLDLVRASK